MKRIGEMSRAELAALVQERFRRRGVDLVLSGGSCVSIYTRGRFVSMDLDMIHTALVSPRRSLIREAMGELGFSEQGRSFTHPATELFVEFPSGPPAVGEEPVKEIRERSESTGLLRMLSPTDCVKDRLTWLYHDQDIECLEQAVLVAQENPVDLRELERWSRGEGKERDFDAIRDRLARKGRRGARPGPRRPRS